MYLITRQVPGVNYADLSLKCIISAKINIRFRNVLSLNITYYDVFLQNRDYPVMYTTKYIQIRRVIMTVETTYYVRYKMD